MKTYKNYRWSENDRLGSGAFGSVYKGQNIHTGKIVAIKVSDNPSKHNEYEINQSIKCENIAEIYEFGFRGHKEFVMIMEFCSGKDLHEMLKMPKFERGLTDRMLIQLIKFFYEIFTIMREKNVVHRDIKPMNICIHRREDGTEIMKLIDFGFCRILPSTATGLSFAGSPEYAHPQLLERFLKVNSDLKSSPGETPSMFELWPTAITLLRCATNLTPFTHREQEKLLKLIKNRPEKAVLYDGYKSKYGYQIPFDRRSSLTLQLRICNQLVLPFLVTSKNCLFKTFFEACQDILQRQRVIFFCPIRGQIQSGFVSSLSHSELLGEFSLLWSRRTSSDHFQEDVGQRMLEAAQRFVQSKDGQQLEILLDGCVMRPDTEPSQPRSAKWSRPPVAIVLPGEGGCGVDWAAVRELDELLQPGLRLLDLDRRNLNPTPSMCFGLRRVVRWIRKTQPYYLATLNFLRQKFLTTTDPIKKLLEFDHHLLQHVSIIVESQKTFEQDLANLISKQPIPMEEELLTNLGNQLESKRAHDLRDRFRDLLLLVKNSWEEFCAFRTSFGAWLQIHGSAHRTQLSWMQALLASLKNDDDREAATSVHLEPSMDLALHNEVEDLVNKCKLLHSKLMELQK